MKLLNTRLYLLVALLIGTVYALSIFEPSFIIGNNAYWTKPFGDRITNLIGALYFAHDSWHFPIFYVPTLATPEGANIIYTDSLPLLALAAKIIFKLTGEWFNYFGLWLFLCFPLLALFVALATKEGGTKSIAAIICAILLALANPALLVRFGHAALMAHFLIVWSFYLYLRLLQHPDSRNVIAQFCIVTALSVVLQAYFLLMVMPFLLAALATVVKTGEMTLRNAATRFIVVIGVVLGTAWISGIIGPGSPSASAWGFGYYSMNLLSPFLPPREHLPEFVTQYVTWDGNGYSWDATGGQYEGYNYLGLGVLLLLAVHLIASRSIIKQALKRHVFLLAALIGLLLLALSNQIFIGNWHVSVTPIFAQLGKLTDHFRTGGRLFWPIYYVLVITLVLVTLQRFNQRVAKVLLVLAVVLQLVDTQLLRRNMAENMHLGSAQVLSQKTWRPLLEGHQFLKQYPSFQCGGWAGKWPDNNANMELLWLAAKLDKPSNSAYLARSNRNCKDELAEGLSFNIEAGGLYVFGNNFPINQIAGLPNFREWCREFKYGVVCSRNWVAFPQIAFQQEFVRISKEWAPEYQLGKTLQFNVNGNGKYFLQRGWGMAESWGVWGIGKQSVVVLRLPDAPERNLKLTVSARALVNAGSPLKEVTVFINDKKIGLWKYKLDEEGIVKRTALVTKDVYQQNNLLIIKFVSKNIESPKRAGMSEDVRPLGLGMAELVLSVDQP
ncbi:DUF6311 domain-containing protein [Sulfuriferula sp. GW1]|uniref:DUF6311 domain-containing protein n=1 Tax=Sulfuriferula sp. GW1 TaxID=3345111 RepID=UPI0039B05102